MKPFNSYQTTSYDVAPINKDIDYFKLSVESFEKNGFDITMNVIPLASTEHLNVEKHLSTIDHDRLETVALNIQVGKGKTTACYELIKWYANKNYYVIVLSPFKRLVRKDFDELKKRGLSPFNYEDVDETMKAADKNQLGFQFKPHIDHNIHIMTINCLLQNPGDKAFEQMSIKQRYLNSFLKHAEEVEQKVVFFFDEIHESVHNFKDEFVPNLYKWRKVVHKAYVSSATFTPSAMPVLEYIAGITGKRITCYETPRRQINTPTSLHLHFTSRNYSSKDLAPLKHLVEIIKSNTDKKISILTAHKSVAKELLNAKENPDSEIVKAVSSLKPNVLTGDDEGDFAQNGNNIGTTFKTGVDIQESDSVFVVIMPCVSDRVTNYAIFSDGLPSIIQSIARIRHTGQVHIFMPMPEAIIDNTEGLPTPIRRLFDSLLSTEFESQNSFYSKLIEMYEKKKERVSDEIQAIRAAQQDSQKPEYSYTSLASTLIGHSQEKLVNGSYSYGKQIAPYVLWAAMNDQFCTSSLREITITRPQRNIVAITKDSVQERVSEVIQVETLTTVQSLSLLDGLNHILDRLRDGVPPIDGEAIPLRFEYNGKEFTPTELRDYPFFMRALINLLAYVHSDGTVSSINKEQYILACVMAARKSKTHATELAKQYAKLATLRVEFLVFIYKVSYVWGDNIAIRQDAASQLDDEFVRKAVETVVKLKKIDPLLMKKVFQFSVSLNTSMSIDKARERVYTEFRDCFTNITTERKYPTGGKETFFLVNGSIDKRLPPGFDKIPLL